jgi:hypothetical protein
MRKCVSDVAHPQPDSWATVQRDVHRLTKLAVRRGFERSSTVSGSRHQGTSLERGHSEAQSQSDNEFPTRGFSSSKLHNVVNDMNRPNQATLRRTSSQHASFNSSPITASAVHSPHVHPGTCCLQQGAPLLSPLPSSNLF